MTYEYSCQSENPSIFSIDDNVTPKFVKYDTQFLLNNHLECFNCFYNWTSVVNYLQRVTQFVQPHQYGYNRHKKDHKLNIIQL